MAIASKIQKSQVAVVDSLEMQVPKTRQVAAMLKAMGLSGKSTLIATEGHNPVVYRSARNIDRVEISPVADLNALAVLKPRQVVFTRAALDWLKAQASQADAS
jgi:large subunit ribosomal protein L4